MKTRADFAKTGRIVVKIGSRLLADDLHERVGMLAEEFAALRARGGEGLLVTSGAIALGVRHLQLPARPTAIPELQASAAVGQSRLMQVYDAAFAAVGLVAGQVLLTHDDVSSRTRYLNARHTLNALLTMHAVPIINENDTVSVDEIKFGDNDRLAALVASLVQAELLVILTDVAGLYDGDPKNASAKLLPDVHDFAAAERLAGGATSTMGTGGMRSKVQAAKVAALLGVPTVVCSGREPNIVTRVCAGESLGTAFWPNVTPLQSRKHWIAYALKSAGAIKVDAGAARALTTAGKSLLPSGIVDVDGNFSAGDAIGVIDPGGVEIGRGLTAYGADEVRKIAGKQTFDLQAALGYKSVDEVIHRDDFVLL